MEIPYLNWIYKDYSSPLETYAKTMKHLLARRNDYNITWPGHHDKPVEVGILNQFLEATEGILAKKFHGDEVELGKEKAKLLSYKDIGIVYKKNI